MPYSNFLPPHRLSAPEFATVWLACQLEGDDFQEWKEVYRDWISLEMTKPARRARIKKEQKQYRRRIWRKLVGFVCWAVPFGAALLAIFSFFFFR